VVGSAKLCDQKNITRTRLLMPETHLRNRMLHIEAGFILGMAGWLKTHQEQEWAG